MTSKAKWYFFMRTKLMAEMRDAEVNPRAFSTRYQWVDSNMIKNRRRYLLCAFYFYM
ncbi:MAG: hypothetical protein HN583_07945 [Kordiimonadaceae bacterium]|nr:hypothetical protein [Kordiimonadaceae bacterium]MBT7605601.1 hypothetical protein [Kordiimonadaceae bacterium]